MFKKRNYNYGVYMKCLHFILMYKEIQLLLERTDFQKNNGTFSHLFRLNILLIFNAHNNDVGLPYTYTLPVM